MYERKALHQLHKGGSACQLVSGSTLWCISLQVKELKQHQPGCSCYIVLTKIDLLENPILPSVQAPASTVRSGDQNLGISAIPESQQTAIQEASMVEEVNTPIHSEVSNSSGPEFQQSSVSSKEAKLREGSTSSPLSPLEWTCSGIFYILLLVANDSGLKGQESSICTRQTWCKRYLLQFSTMFRFRPAGLIMWWLAVIEGCIIELASPYISGQILQLTFHEKRDLILSLAVMQKSPPRDLK